MRITVKSLEDKAFTRSDLIKEIGYTPVSYRGPEHKPYDFVIIKPQATGRNDLEPRVAFVCSIEYIALSDEEFNGRPYTHQAAWIYRLIVQDDNGRWVSAEKVYGANDWSAEGLLPYSEDRFAALSQKGRMEPT